MGKSIWNPRTWPAWEQVLGASVVGFVIIAGILALNAGGALTAWDDWLDTPEGGAVARSFAVVALIFAVFTSVVGAFFLWLSPFLYRRAEKREEAVRQEVREALEVPRHNHVTRDIKPRGVCPACDLYHDNHPRAEEQ